MCDGMPAMSNMRYTEDGARCESEVPARCSSDTHAYYVAT